MRFFLPMTLILALGSCVAPKAPAPVSNPVPPRVIPPPPPLPRADPSIPWADRALTPGDWVYRGGSARFDPYIILYCDRAKRQVGMNLMGGRPDEVITIRTTSGNDAVRLGADAHARFDVYAPVLDRMAFSRGRFAIEREYMDPWVIPAWPEVARVVEDCRA